MLAMAPLRQIARISDLLRSALAMSEKRSTKKAARKHQMRSSKSRSRGNKNRSRPSGNIVNRVFDSSGPDGKVRGTPQQIIDKYNQLHRDAQLAGDRVDAENFAQHAEHYQRMLTEAQREIEARREQQEEQNRQRQAERDRERAERLKAQEETAAGDGPQPDVIDSAEADASDAGPVETPEGQPKPRRARKPRKPRATAEEQSAEPVAAPAAAPAEAPQPPAED